MTSVSSAQNTDQNFQGSRSYMRPYYGCSAKYFLVEPLLGSKSLTDQSGAVVFFINSSLLEIPFIIQP